MRFQLITPVTASTLSHFPQGRVLAANDSSGETAFGTATKKYLVELYTNTLGNPSSRRTRSHRQTQLPWQTRHVAASGPCSDT